MKKTMLALTGAVIILAGCQDEKPAEQAQLKYLRQRKLKSPPVQTLRLRQLTRYQ